MKRFSQEVDENFNKFSTTWPAEMEASHSALTKFKDEFKASYRRIVSLQAWKIELTTLLDAESYLFLVEAQNDALTSHVLAGLGSWRTALKSLRSCIENIFFCLYYKDHPVELELWLDGRHKLAFTEMLRYFENHPALHKNNIAKLALTGLSSEYSTLSKAVHASATAFRMSSAQSTALWKPNEISLRMWATREKTVLINLNLLLLVLYQEILKGTRLPHLRKAISLIIPKGKHLSIHNEVGVSLYS